MSGIFDIDGVNWDNISLPSAGGVGISLPPGFWPVTITDVKMQSASEGKPDYIAVSMRVSGTDQEGVDLRDMLHVHAENEIARRISFQRIKSLSIACGLPAGEPDEGKYIGVEVFCEIRAGVNKKTGEPIKNVHAYHNPARALADGVAVGPSGQLVESSSARAPAAKIEEPPVKSKPWQKKA